MRWVLLLLLSTLTAPVALGGGDDAGSAELVRLRTDLERLTQKEAWKGVERLYPKLMEQGGLSVRDHLLASRAALHLGDTHQAHLRLQRALAVDPHAPVEGDLADVQATLAAINEGYGRVSILVGAGQKPRLEADEMPFEANARASIEHARARLAETRRFRGWIPVGRYDLDGTVFAVEAGAYWKEISTGPQ